MSLSLSDTAFFSTLLRAIRYDYNSESAYVENGRLFIKDRKGKLFRAEKSFSKMVNADEVDVFNVKTGKWNSGYMLAGGFDFSEEAWKNDFVKGFLYKAEEYPGVAYTEKMCNPWEYIETPEVYSDFHESAFMCGLRWAEKKPE